MTLPPNTKALEPVGVLARHGFTMLGVAAGIALLGFMIGGWLLGLVLVAAGAVGFGLVARTWLVASWRWNPPVLVVPADGLCLGGSVAVAYRRTPKGIRDIPRFELVCKLRCEERVTYRRGTDTITETADVVEQQWATFGEGTASGMEATIELVVPTDAGAPTMDLGNNEVSWFLEVETPQSGLPHDQQRFALEVVAVLDERHRPRLQDS